MSDKSPEAFRTISEVADDLELPQHVLRFWETRFAQIKPLKRGGGRRYYRPDDVNLLRGIRHLLYDEGYTIKGVQRILKERGVRQVAGSWREIARDVPPSPTAPAPELQDAVPDAVEAYEDDLDEGVFEGEASLSIDELERLKSVLFDLIECRRMLHEARQRD